jgi:hypothetical protein
MDNVQEHNTFTHFYLGQPSRSFTVHFHVHIHPSLRLQHPVGLFVVVLASLEARSFLFERVASSFPSFLA